MACGGFTCSKNALSALNILYMLVAFVLIGVAAYAHVESVVTSLSIVGGIIACGVFLFLIAILGLIGALKHSQVLLFFYMIILFILFIIQFAIACACLAINQSQQKKLLETAWNTSKPNTKIEFQRTLKCCGFLSAKAVGDKPDMHPPCGLSDLKCCEADVDKKSACCWGSTNTTTDATCPCKVTCWEVASRSMDSALKVTGAVGLFFSFTEIVGVWLTLRYRNQRDPRADPSAFL